MEELVFINEDYFFEKTGQSADDSYLFYGKTYLIEYHEFSDGVTISNPRCKGVRHGPFFANRDFVKKCFCNKIEYRKYKLRKLHDINKIINT